MTTGPDPTTRGPQELLTAAELSIELGNVAEKTLAQWRYLGRGPAYFKLEGGLVRYRRSDVEAWLAACRKETSGAAA